ncbi:MAG: Gfo/Idh/MocA family oxidoreductase [Myxococcota bacterium]|nr:Gfo/Idh/MocA family oxidoreductase [Myxococcota bacterium]
MNIRQKSVAVIGAGYWGKNLVRSFHRLGALHTICDDSEQAQTLMKELYPDTPLVQSFDTVLDNPEIHAISLATPAVHHGEMVRRAILAGKDVLVEKPLCLSASEAAELHQLARTHKRILMVGHLLWYHPAILKLQSLIQGNELGPLRYIYSNRLNMGKLRRHENVLWSFAPHDVSAVLGLVGEMPDSVFTQGGNFVDPRVADTTTSTLHFSSGLRAHIFVSWLHPFKEQKLVVVGEKQMAVFDDTAPWEQKLSLYPHTVSWERNDIPVANKAERQWVPLEECEPLLAECEHFLECLETRQTPRTDGDEATRVLKVLNACEKSMQTRHPTQITAPDLNYFVHETSVIDPGASIGDNTRIWHFSHVLKDAVIGNNCNIGQNVVISSQCKLGNNCKIQNNVSIYDGVVLEDDVFCGPSMVFTNVSNPRSHINRKDEYQETVVRQGASIGANATIVCGNNLGRFSFVGAGAVVTKDVPDYALVVGNPAKRIGWMCACGKKLPKTLTCSACEQRYVENENRLEPLP